MTNPLSLIGNRMLMFLVNMFGSSADINQLWYEYIMKIKDVHTFG